VFPGSSLWEGKLSVKGLLESVFRKYTCKAVWKVLVRQYVRKICNIITTDGSVDPTLSSGAGMALQSCSKLGHGMRHLNPCS
jgi:hypothetical protein